MEPSIFSCKQSWITKSLVNQVTFAPRYDLLLDSNFKVTVCKLPTFSDGDVETEHMEKNAIFEFQLNDKERNGGQPFILCDDLQIITISTPISEGTVKSIITVRDFIKPRIKK